jgi:hypothetical protein
MAQMSFGDRLGLNDFFLAHAQSHTVYAANLRDKYGSDSPLFDLTDPQAARDWAIIMASKKTGQMTPRLKSWLQAHADLHTAELTVTQAAAPVDLITVDFGDEGQFNDWMSNHILLHDIEDGVLS